MSMSTCLNVQNECPFQPSDTLEQVNIQQKYIALNIDPTQANVF